MDRPAVGLRVRPLAEERANAFGPAIGLGTVRPGELVADLEPAAARLEVVASIVAAVVCQQSAGRDAVGGISRVGPFQEADGGRPPLVSEHLGVAHAGAIVDGDVDVLPADPAHARRAVAMHAATHAAEFPSFFTSRWTKVPGRRRS